MTLIISVDLLQNTESDTIKIPSAKFNNIKSKMDSLLNLFEIVTEKHSQIEELLQMERLLLEVNTLLSDCSKDKKPKITKNQPPKHSLLKQETPISLQRSAPVIRRANTMAPPPRAAKPKMPKSNSQSSGQTRAMTPPTISPSRGLAQRGRGRPLPRRGKPSSSVPTRTPPTPPSQAVKPHSNTVTMPTPLKRKVPNPSSPMNDSSDNTITIPETVSIQRDQPPSDKPQPPVRKPKTATPSLRDIPLTQSLPNLSAYANRAMPVPPKKPMPSPSSSLGSSANIPNTTTNAPVRITIIFKNIQINYFIA